MGAGFGLDGFGRIGRKGGADGVSGNGCRGNVVLWFTASPGALAAAPRFGLFVHRV